MGTYLCPYCGIKGRRKAFFRSGRFVFDASRKSGVIDNKIKMVYFFGLGYQQFRGIISKLDIIGFAQRYDSS